MIHLNDDHHHLNQHLNVVHDVIVVAVVMEVLKIANQKNLIRNVTVVKTIMSGEKSHVDHLKMVIEIVNSDRLIAIKRNQILNCPAN